jgi:hypothetical protein
MIDERLRAAADELIAATQAIMPPTARRRSVAGPVLAVAAAAAVVVVALPFAPRSTTPETDSLQVPFVDTVTTTNADTPTATEAVRLLFVPVPIGDDPIVANPETTREDALAQLGFNPDSLGTEAPLSTFDDLALARSAIGSPHLFTTNTDARTWTLAGVDPTTGAIIVVSDAPDTRSVCVGIPGQAPTCGAALCDIDGQADDCHRIHGTTGGGNEDLIPIGWLVPDGTAVVGYTASRPDGQQVRRWQIPSAGAVGFVSTPDETVTLTAYDRFGATIEAYESPLTSSADDGGDLLPGVTVELYRVLLDQGFPAIIAVGTEAPADADPNSDLTSVTDWLRQQDGVESVDSRVFAHADGTNSQAIFIDNTDGTQATIWSDNKDWLRRLSDDLRWTMPVAGEPRVSLSESGGATLIIVTTDPKFP